MQTGVEMECIDKMSLIEWLANNYKTFGKFNNFNALCDAKQDQQLENCTKLYFELPYCDLY